MTHASQIDPTASETGGRQADDIGPTAPKPTAPKPTAPKPTAPHSTSPGPSGLGSAAGFGWTLEDIERQSADLWARARLQAAELQAQHGVAQSPAGHAAGDPATGAPPVPTPVSGASLGEDDPRVLVEGTKILFGEMVAAQQHAARTSTAELLNRVFSIYGLTPPPAARAEEPGATRTEPRPEVRDHEPSNAEKES